MKLELILERHESHFQCLVDEHTVFSCGVDAFLKQNFNIYAKNVGLVIMTAPTEMEAIPIMDIVQIVAAEIYNQIFKPLPRGVSSPQIMWVIKFLADKVCRFERYETVTFKVVPVPGESYSLLIDPIFRGITPEQIEHQFGYTFAQMALPERASFERDA